jgi:GT2 family glycosyltransferase
MVVTIPHFSNQLGLTALLINLQPQLNENDIFYIVDNSVNKSGFAIAKMFNTHRSIMLVETSGLELYQSWNAGIDCMLENNQEGVLIINDDVLFSQTAISSLKRAKSNHLAYTFACPNRAYSADTISSYFKWYGKPNLTIKDTDWLTGFAFYLKKDCVKQFGKFNEDFKIWYGDDEYADRIQGKIGRITSEYVYHFGSKSYGYKDSETQRKIQLDRLLYRSIKKSQSS